MMDKMERQLAKAENGSQENKPEARGFIIEEAGILQDYLEENGDELCIYLETEKEGSKI